MKWANDHGQKAETLIQHHAKEAVCYGPLHPDGKRLPADLFIYDPNRLNHLSELCIECQVRTPRPDPPAKTSPGAAFTPAITSKICTDCGKPGKDPTDDFKHPMPGRCGPCRRAWYRKYRKKNYVPTGRPAGFPQHLVLTPEKRLVCDIRHLRSVVQRCCVNGQIGEQLKHDIMAVIDGAPLREAEHSQLPAAPPAEPRPEYLELSRRISEALAALNQARIKLSAIRRLARKLS